MSKGETIGPETRMCMPCLSGSGCLFHLYEKLFKHHIHSSQIKGGKVETVTDFVSLSSKITVDGDCSHEIKRCLPLGRKAMTNLLYLLSRVWLFVTPWTVAYQAPLSVGILQARILEWVAMPSSRGYSQPRDWTQVSRIAGRFFTNWATREAQEY